MTLAGKYAGRGNVAKLESSIKLAELGPRLSLQLCKVQRGVFDGDVLYHAFRDGSVAGDSVAADDSVADDASDDEDGSDEDAGPAADESADDDASGDASGDEDGSDASDAGPAAPGAWAKDVDWGDDEVSGGEAVDAGFDDESEDEEEEAEPPAPAVGDKRPAFLYPKGLAKAKKAKAAPKKSKGKASGKRKKR